MLLNEESGVSVAWRCRLSPPRIAAAAGQAAAAAAGTRVE